MCERFAMSAWHPATVKLLLEEFSGRGGLTGPHEDGWGIGWYDQNDIRLDRIFHTRGHFGTRTANFVFDDGLVPAPVLILSRIASFGRTTPNPR